MQTKTIWANVAVQDLDRTTQFYTQLGFTPNGRSAALSSFRFGEHGFIIHFFVREQLQQFVPQLADLSRGYEIIFSLSAASTDEVDQWAEAVRQAGGSILREPAPYDQGYTCVFADPDGHIFNVLYWPEM